MTSRIRVKTSFESNLLSSINYITPLLLQSLLYHPPHTNNFQDKPSGTIPILLVHSFVPSSATATATPLSILNSNPPPPTHLSPSYVSSMHSIAAPLLTQWSQAPVSLLSGLWVGTSSATTKFVLCPVVLSVPALMLVLYMGQL